MSTQQWRKTLIFMSLFLSIAWSAMGFTPDRSFAVEETDYFPAPTQAEIQAILQNVHRQKVAMGEMEPAF